MNKNQLIKFVLAAGAVYLITQATNSSGSSNGGNKLSFIKDATNHEADSIFNRMSSAEIDTVYTFLKDYTERGTTLVTAPASYRDKLLAISNKYNIFT